MATITVPDDKVPVTDVKAPTVGRIVHYYPKGISVFTGKGPYAALVTGTHEGSLNANMQVMHDSELGAHHIANVPHKSTAGTGIYWEWPPMA